MLSVGADAHIGPPHRTINNASVGGGVPDAPPHRTINNASVGVGLPDDPPDLAAHFPKKIVLHA